MPYDSGMIFGGGTADDAGDIGVSLDNLGELDRVLASAAQRREAHLYELAYSLVRSLPEPSLGALSESYRETARRLTASLCGSASELFPPRSLRDGVNPIGAPELLGMLRPCDACPRTVRRSRRARACRRLPGRAARRVYIAHRACARMLYAERLFRPCRRVLYPISLHRAGRLYARVQRQPGAGVRRGGAGLGSVLHPPDRGSVRGTAVGG